MDGRCGKESIRDVVGDRGFGGLRIVCVSDYQTNHTGVGGSDLVVSQILHQKAEGVEGSVGREIHDTTVRRHIDDSRIVLVSILVIDG